ncbi:Globin domain-containing protein [Caenorhabditis elegans]|uniref:Globin domain-containing protein n=1 Tax=Caenorhabditis elegans TaxID=6239 RepID=O76629_CAEEL|nr:Globin family profile domain-containing protein [Caenorhabditis elegans]CCD71450.1 Globin family profile domain-containing protein [Caenorhabditis elegans]|eukprot:NP_493944.1 GLoBin related [Caenorhabditis elegans]
MGIILAYFRRPKLDIDRVRSVWMDHINGNDQYFQEVIHRICKRNEGIRCAMLAPNAQHAESVAEEDFVLSNIADRISQFFHQLVEDDVLMDTVELKKACYDLGRQHSSYSKQQFKMSYWEEFTLTMMGVLEQNYPETTKEEQKAWLHFLRFVNENMLDGYLDAISRSNK